MGRNNIKRLAGLLFTNNIGEAAAKTQRHGKWVECVIGIDDDHTAYLTMHVDDYNAFQDRYIERMERRANV